MMLIFPGGLHDTDYGYNNTDNRNDNTSYTDYGFHILCSFPLIFHLCITSEILEVLKMYSFWRKANRFRSGSTSF